MSRTIGAAVQAALAASNVPLLIFVELDFSGGFVRVTNAPYAFDWNGYTWTGLGRMGGIEAVNEGASLEARGLALKLSGVPLSGEGASENISTALNENYQGRDARVWVAPLGANAYLQLPGTSGNYASTPDSAAVSITGDIDLRAKIAPNDWTPAAQFEILNKDNGSNGNRSFLFGLNTGGKLTLLWTPDGNLPRFGSASTVATGFADGSAHWVRATLDVDDGAGGWILRYYTSEDGVSWTQLGSDVTGAGTTSIFDGPSQLNVAAFSSGSSDLFAGKVYYAELRNGIDGQVVAVFDPSRDDLSSTGEVWTINRSGSDHARLVRDPFSVLADPKLIFLGRMDTMEMQIGKTAVITLTAESRLADLERPRVRRFNDADQQAQYPGDRGLEWAERMVEWAGIWGKRR